MPAKTVYHCDGCGKDLSRTALAVEFRLALKCELIWEAGPATGPRLPKMLAEDAYFCGWVCLEKWLTERRKS